jgi:SAM-dependent methyltransferase
MGQVTTGIRAVLSNPAIYDFSQRLMGAGRNRRWMQETFFKARDGERVLDVGCGTAAVLSVLPDVEYHGYDISLPYIELARSRYAGRGQFHAALLDEPTVRQLGAFDLVLATGLLHHLNDDEVRSLFRTLSPALAQGGRLITVDGTFVDGQNPFARWIIAKDRGQNVRTPTHYERLARETFSKVAGHLIHRRWFPYTYWIMDIRGPLA